MVRLECPLCDYEYSHSNPAELEGHIYNSHLVDLAGDDNCPSCEVSFTEENAQFHYDCFDETSNICVPKTNKSPSFGCPLCSKMMESERDLRIHLTKHPETDRYEFISDNEGRCKFCGEEAEGKVASHSSCISDYASPDSDVSSSSTKLDPLSDANVSVEAAPDDTLSRDQLNQYLSGLESFVDSEMELEKKRREASI
jgi:rubredoxin